MGPLCWHMPLVLSPRRSESSLVRCCVSNPNPNPNRKVRIKFGSLLCGDGRVSAEATTFIRLADGSGWVNETSSEGELVVEEALVEVPKPGKQFVYKTICEAALLQASIR